MIENFINTTVNNNPGPIPLSIYLLNATSIAKPHTIQTASRRAIECSWYHNDNRKLVEVAPSRLCCVHPWLFIFSAGSQLRLNRAWMHAYTASPDYTYKDDIKLLWVKFEFNSCLCFVEALYNPPKLIYTTETVRKALEWIFAINKALLAMVSWILNSSLKYMCPLSVKTHSIIWNLFITSDLH